MEYMRGLLRDNDLFRAYVTVRAVGWLVGGAESGPTLAAGARGRGLP